jgi:hypothetical protein
METGDITMKSTAVSVSTVLQLLIGALSLAAALKPALFDTARDSGGLWLYLVLSGLFLLLAVLYLAKLKLRRR